MVHSSLQPLVQTQPKLSHNNNSCFLCPGSSLRKWHQGVCKLYNTKTQYKRDWYGSWPNQNSQQPPFNWGGWIRCLNIKSDPLRSIEAKYCQNPVLNAMMLKQKIQTIKNHNKAMFSAAQAARSMHMQSSSIGSWPGSTLNIRDQGWRLEKASLAGSTEKASSMD